MSAEAVQRTPLSRRNGRRDQLLPAPAAPLESGMAAVEGSRDLPGPWGLRDAAGEEAALVLPVLATVIEQTGGRRRQLTRDEAEWVVKLRRAVPESRMLPHWKCYQLAQLYVAAAAANADEMLASLDELVAFRPWSGRAARARYLAAKASRSAPRATWVGPGPDDLLIEPQTDFVALVRRLRVAVDSPLLWMLVMFVSLLAVPRLAGDQGSLSTIRSSEILPFTRLPTPAPTESVFTPRPTRIPAAESGGRTAAPAPAR